MLAEFLPGISVELHDANGEPFSEYPLEAGDTVPDKTVAKYLEITPGARFVIDVRCFAEFEYANNDLRFLIEADGQPLKAKSTRARYRVQFEGQSHGSANQWFSHYYSFSNLKTTEDDSDETWTAAVRALGEIKIQVVRCRRSTPAKRKDHESKNALGRIFKRGVPEKAMKGRCVSAHVTLMQADKKGRRRPGKILSTQYPWGKEPIATFVFKYGSRRDLQSLGIILRDPTPVPLEQRDPNSLSVQEYFDLARLLRARADRTGQLTFVKREQDEDMENIDITANNGEVVFQRTKICGIPDEIIDLTGDAA